MKTNRPLFYCFALCCLAAAALSLPTCGATPPGPCLELHCPTNVLQYTCGSNCVRVELPFWATNLCNPTDLHLRTDIPTNNCFNLGTTWVHVMATGSGQTNWCQFPVTVLPDPNCSSPTNCLELHCPTNFVAYACGTKCIPVNHGAWATNRCNPQDLAVTYDPPLDHCFDPGTAWVTMTAISSSESQSCTFPVTVLTNCPPTDCLELHCPSNFVAYACGTKCIPVNHGAWATNRCNPQDLAVTYDPPLDHCYDPGTTWVTMTAISSSEHQSCTFPVTVLTNCPPPRFYRGYSVVLDGGATIATNVSGQLDLSQLSGPADSGLRFNTGAFGSTRVRFAERLAAAPDSRGGVFGVTVAGLDGQPLAEMQATNVLNGFDLIARLPDAQVPARHTLRAWKGSTLVFEQAHRDLPAANSYANHTWLYATPDEAAVHLDAGGHLVIDFTLNGGDYLAVADATGRGISNLNADRIEFVSEAVITPRPNQPPADFLSALELRLRLPAMRTIVDFLPAKFGHIAQGFGAAELMGEPNRLRVTVHGPDASDGVRFDLGGKSSAELTLELPRAGGVTRLDAPVEGPNGSLGAFTLATSSPENWDSHFEIQMDFNPIQAAGIRMEAWQGEFLVAVTDLAPIGQLALQVTPNPGAPALKLGARVDTGGAVTRTFSLPGGSFTASLTGAFDKLGPLDRLQFTSLGNSPVPPGSMKLLSVRGQTEAVGFMNITGLSSSSSNPFQPEKFVGDLVTPLGNATFDHDANGDLILGNLAAVGTANGVRMDYAPTVAPRDHAELQFDRAIPGKSLPLGSMFRYELDGPSGPLSTFEAVIENTSWYYISRFNARTLRLYAKGSLVLTDNPRPNGLYIAFDTQPSKVAVRLGTDGSVVWTFGWPTLIGMQGTSNSGNPPPCDMVEIVSQPNTVPPGSTISAAQFKGSGVPSRTLLAPPPTLTSSLTAVDGTPTLELGLPMSHRDLVVEEGAFGSAGTLLWKPLLLPVMIDKSVRKALIPVDLSPIKLVRVWERPAPADCAAPAAGLMQYFRTDSPRWTLTNLWVALAGSAVPAATTVNRVQTALSAELETLDAAGTDHASAPYRHTREMLDESSIADVGDLPDATGAAGFPVVTYHVTAGPADPAADGTPAHPFRRLLDALDHARSSGDHRIELRVSGDFVEPALAITRHTRIVGDCPESGCANLQSSLQVAEGCRLDLENLNAPGHETLAVSGNRDAYLRFTKVALQSVHGFGSTLVMRECTVSTGLGALIPWPGVWLDGGSQAVLDNCILYNNAGGGLLAFGTSLKPAHVRLLRTCLNDNHTVQGTFDALHGESIAGVIGANGYATIQMDWCQVHRNRGPAVVAIGSHAEVCLRYTSIARVLPVLSDPTAQFAIGLGAYRGGFIGASFCDLSGRTEAVSPLPDFAIQLATGGYANIAATRIRNFRVPANVQPGSDPSGAAITLDQYCLYEGPPLLPVNRDVVPTPAP